MNGQNGKFVKLRANRRFFNGYRLAIDQRQMISFAKQNRSLIEDAVVQPDIGMFRAGHQGDVLLGRNR